MPDETVGPLLAVPNGQYFFGASRSPLTASFRFVPNPSRAEANYIAVFGNIDGSEPTPSFKLDSTLGFGDGFLSDGSSPGWTQPLAPLWWDDTDPESTEAYHPHGPTLYSVVAPDGFHAVYLDGPAEVYRTKVHLFYTDTGLTYNYVTPTPGDAWSVPGVYFSIFRLIGDQWDNVGTVVQPAQPELTPASFQLSVDIPGPGYYRVVVSTPAITTKLASTGTLRTLQATILDPAARIEFSVQTGIIGFSPIPHLPSLDQDVMGLRVNAVSAMLTPHPALLYEGGQVAGVQLPSCCSWDQPLENRDPFSYINALQTSYTTPLKNGIYAFHKPTGVDNFDLQAPFVFRKGVIVGINNPLVPVGGWIVAAATVPLTDGSYPSGACHATLCYGVEFQTTNTWFNVLPPSLTPREYDLALEILRTTAQWHDNPLHVRDIIRTIASKGRALLRVAPSVARVIGALFPGVSISTAVVDAAAALGSAL